MDKAAGGPGETFLGGGLLCEAGGLLCEAGGLLCEAGGLSCDTGESAATDDVVTMKGFKHC